MAQTRLEDLRSDLRFARFIAKSIYHSQIALRPGQNLSPALLLERHAARTGDAPFLLFEDERLSYAEVNRRANRVAHALTSLGARAGDVVAVLLDNRPELVATVLGANKVGVCSALLNTSVVGPQLEHVLTIAKPSFVVVGAEHAQKLGEIASNLPVPTERVLVVRDGTRDAPPGLGFTSFDALTDASATENPASTAGEPLDRPCVYIYTSGTTGLPKAAAMKNVRFLKAATLFSKAVIELRDSDVVYGAGLPLYHSSGMILGVGSSLVAGAAYGIRRKFSASAHWDDVSRWNASVFTYIGELARYLVNAPEHPLEKKHRVRMVVGAGMRPDVWKRFVERFNHPVVAEFYGATEGNVGIVNVDGRMGMMGRMLPGQTVLDADEATGELRLDAEGRARVVPEGAVGLLVGEINRVNSFDGYVDSAKNASKVLRNPLGDGKDYFNTGDLVQRHPRRYVSFRDRLGDTFRWKGENVATNEVQEALNRCPGVLESNVYGVEVPGTDGRAGMAALVVDGTFDPATLAAHVRETLPTYARPLFLRVSREIETTGTFKHVKTVLRAQGYDPEVVDEPLYFFEDGARYVALDARRFDQLRSGTTRL